MFRFLHGGRLATVIPLLMKLTKELVWELYKFHVVAQGSIDGAADGRFDGASVGLADGAVEGFLVGAPVGLVVGALDGISVGLADGAVDGFFDGSSVGLTDGFLDGASVGLTEGASVGLLDGASVGAGEISYAYTPGRLQFDPSKSAFIWASVVTPVIILLEKPMLANRTALKYSSCEYAKIAHVPPVAL